MNVLLRGDWCHDDQTNLCTNQRKAYVCGCVGVWGCVMGEGGGQLEFTCDHGPAGYIRLFQGLCRIYFGEKGSQGRQRTKTGSSAFVSIRQHTAAEGGAAAVCRLITQQSPRLKFTIQECTAECPLSSVRKLCKPDCTLRSAAVERRTLIQCPSATCRWGK